MWQCYRTALPLSLSLAFYSASIGSFGCDQSNIKARLSLLDGLKWGLRDSSCSCLTFLNEKKIDWWIFFFFLKCRINAFLVDGTILARLWDLVFEPLSSLGSQYILHVEYYLSLSFKNWSLTDNSKDLVWRTWYLNQSFLQMMAQYKRPSGTCSYSGLSGSLLGRDKVKTTWDRASLITFIRLKQLQCIK